MPVDETPLDVGMSSNVLEFGDTPGRLDGIGVYTQALEAALIARGVAVRRIGAPMRVGARFVAARHASLSFPLPMASRQYFVDEWTVLPNVYICSSTANSKGNPTSS